MRKTIAIISIILCIAVYYCSNNADLIEKYTDFREKKPFIGSDKSGLGWLYSLCYLSDYRIPYYYTIHPANKSDKNNIDLYLISDSYLYFPTKKYHYYGVDSFVKIKWWSIESYRNIQSLRKDKHNVLVIEMTERYVRDICSNYYGMINALKIDSSFKIVNQPKTIVNEELSFSSFLEKHLFNPNINSNLELNLFDYYIFRPIKELKADFNHRIFNRVNNSDVFVDDNNHFLYYMPTVQGEQKMNSFFPLDATELPTICGNLNQVYDYYKANGFEEVYFAIIPNPVTMVNPNLFKYNDLIPQIYAVDSMRMKFFNIYSIFAKNPQKYYSRNDTHWNSEGLQTWLNEFNNILEIISKEPFVKQQYVK
jgi:hypothetical protein